MYPRLRTGQEHSSLFWILHKIMEIIYFSANIHKIVYNCHLIRFSFICFYRLCSIIYTYWTESNRSVITEVRADIDFLVWVSSVKCELRTVIRNFQTRDWIPGENFTGLSLDACITCSNNRLQLFMLSSDSKTFLMSYKLESWSKTSCADWDLSLWNGIAVVRIQSTMHITRSGRRSKYTDY